jgi:hypothetical protein
MLSILLLTAPLFLLIALGALLRRATIITEEGIHALNRIVYAVALPAVIFSSFARIDWLGHSVLFALAFNTLILLALTGTMLFVLHLFRIPRRFRGPATACAIVGNTVYLGFPIGTQFLGPDLSPLFFAAATPHLVLGIAVAVLVIEYYTLGVHDPRRFIKDFTHNPLIIALASGIVFGVLHLAATPLRELLRPIDMLAATASPLALLTLGAFLSGQFRRRNLSGVFAVTTIKLALFPLIVGVGAVMFGMPHTTVTASVIAAAMPTAITVFSVADRYDAETTFVANVILLSTLLSFLTITLTLAFLA